MENNICLNKHCTCEEDNCTCTEDMCNCAEEIQRFIKLTLLLQKQVFKSQELSISQASTILSIFHHPNISMGELSKMDGIDISTLSRNIKQLEKKEWAIKTLDIQDKRIGRITLTLLGQQKALEIKKSLSGEIQQLLCNIPQQEFKQISNAVFYLITILEKNGISL